MDLVTAIILGASLILLYFLVIIPCKNIVTFWNIPSHEAWPIVGNILQMSKFQDEFNHLYETWVSKYGRGPVVIWGTYWFPVVLLGDGNDVKKVLYSREHVEKGVLYRALDLSIGTGAFNSPVDIWRQRRPHLEQAFHTKVYQQLPPIFDRCSRLLLQALQNDEKVSSGQVFDIHPFLNLCSIQMLVEGALGVEVDPYCDSDKEFWNITIQNYQRGTYLAEYRMLRPYYLFSNILWDLNPLSKEMKNVVELLHKNLCTKFLNAKRGMLKTNNNNNSITEKPKQFLELLLHLQKTKPELELSDQELVYEIASIFIAGTDASSKTMSFLLLFLALHQDCQDKVINELDVIFDGDLDRSITDADCKRMLYLDSCIRETLRLMPPVSFITRKAGSDIHLDNNRCIPKGTEIVLSIYSVHRNPEVYPQPNTFCPDRWKNEISQGHFIPWSSGPRACLGPKFAMMEIKILAANILRHYKLDTAQGMDTWIIRTNITLNLEGGWNIRLKKR